jgi:thymidylate synthase (FAD)
MVLPQSMMTEYYVTGSLYAWARAYNLRKSSTAQLEIQDLASEWNRIVGALFPISWEALTKD